MKLMRLLTGVSLLTLIFLAFFVPTTYQPIKIIFLMTALFGIAILASHSKLTWSRDTLFACFLIATVGLINSTHGLVNGAPGAIRVLTVMAAWPLLFGIFSTMLNHSSSIKMVTSTVTLSLIAVLFYSFLFLGYTSGITPTWLYFELNQGQAFGWHAGTIEYNLYSITSLLFLMPFWLHYLLRLNLNDKAKTRHWIILFVGLVLCVLTGRRAVQMVVVLSPILVIATEALVGDGIRSGFKLFSKLFNLRNAGLTLTGAMILLISFALMDVRLYAVVANFVSGFDFDNAANLSATARTNQFVLLMNAWIDNYFLFGAGNGSHIDYLRSIEMPWAYELTYVYLLFSTGIFGVLFYFSWFGWGLLRVRNALHLRRDMRTSVTPFITGVFGLAIGAATNPYFVKFDFLWIIFLPHLLAGAIIFQSQKVAYVNQN